MKWKKGGMKRAREREKNVLMLQSESVIKSVGALFKKIVICTAFSTVLYVVVDILVPEVVQTLTQNRFIYICEHTWKMMILFSWHLIFFCVVQLLLINEWFLLRWSVNVECEGSNEYLKSLNALLTLNLM